MKRRSFFKLLGGLLGASLLPKLPDEKSEITFLIHPSEKASKQASDKEVNSLLEYDLKSNLSPKWPEFDSAFYYGASVPLDGSKHPTWYRLNKDGTPDGFYSWNEQEKAWLKA